MSRRHDERNEFEEAVQADMMVNSLIRVAKDLEKILTASYIIAGLLFVIAFVAVLHLFNIHNI